MESRFFNRLENLIPWLILLLMHSETKSAFGLSLLSIILLLISFIKLNKETKGIVLILFSAPIFVLLFRILGFSITALPLSLGLGIYLLRTSWGKISNKVIISYLGLVAIFIIWFIYGPQHAYAQTKLNMSIIIGAGSIFAWNSLMGIEPVEAKKLARILIAISLFYMSVALEFFGFAYPSSIFDFDSFRVGFTNYIKTSDDIPFTYHSMGVPILFACALFLASPDILKKSQKVDDIILLILCLYLVLLSQARQAILGVFLVTALRVWLSQTLSSAYKAALIIGSTGILLILFIGLETTAFTQATSEGNLAVNRNYDRAFDLIKDSPFLGVGLGGYSLTGIREYPHSIFWELLSEFGLLGLTLVIVFSSSRIILNPRKAIHYVNQHGQIPLLIIVAFGVRALSSSDLTESIVWLVAIITYNSAILKPRLSLNNFIKTSKHE